MRLFMIQDDGKLTLTKDLTSSIPPYAILSHTWGTEDEEVTFRDIVEGTGDHKDGYRKIQFCAKQAASHGLQYFWVDSCCIDKSNSTELSQAINSMFRWYHNAVICYVYLSDVSTGGYQSNAEFLWESTFRKSRWFTRGWTLQELIAPSSVEFFSVEGQRLGDKGSLERQLHEITGIAPAALRGSPLSDFSRRERMLWAEGRTTKFKEDMAYSLLGIFEVHLPLIYGEGIKHAFRRLEEEIDKQVAFERGRLRDHQRLKLEPFSLVPSSVSEVEESCLRSLWFPSMNTRRLNLEKPAEQTCLWLFEHEVYQDWFLGRNRDKHSGLLRLNGKPGTGKSILMKEAFRRAVLGQDKSDYRTAAFFFNAKGGELENSPLGLFRSLLHQLLPRDLEHLQRFRKLWNERNSGRYPWQETELRSFFQSMFANQRAKRTIIFIDALDECDSKSIRSQASFWRGITRSAYEAKVHLNVCLSIRDFPMVTMRNCPEIVVENHNSHDITTYVKQKFTLSIAAKEPQWELLKDKVLRKSAGVFLWVVLVVDDVLEKWDGGDGVHSLLKQLDVVPEELEALFSQMFLSLDPGARDITLRLFQWAVLAAKPLRLHEWHHIMAFIRQPILSSLHEWRGSDNFTKDDDQLEKQIRSVSKGLIEKQYPYAPEQGPLTSNAERHGSFKSYTSRYPKGTDERSGGCLDATSPPQKPNLYPTDRARSSESHGARRNYSPPSCDVKRKYHGRTPSPSSRQMRGRRGPASVFGMLKKSSDFNHIDMSRWLETLLTGKCIADPISLNESAFDSPTPLSVTGQSQVLEDYPALLSYATSEFFTHARLAEETGVDPSPIVNRLLEKGIWARWVTLREDVPQGVELWHYAADRGLNSWVSIFSQPPMPRRGLPLAPELEVRDPAFTLYTVGSKVPVEYENENENTQMSLSHPFKRSASVASFSSAGSHRGDMEASIFAGSAKSPVTAKKPAREPRPQLFCEKCNEYPEGFNGELLLRMHDYSKHRNQEKRWICIHPSEAGLTVEVDIVKPLDKCRACKARKEYRTYHNLAAHLRRSHFRDKPARAGNKNSAADDVARRGGKGGAVLMPPGELMKWMKAIYVNQEN
ncbi:hypothetical protein E0Z10_g2760 [Xylaria hypoxylon]|uniref:Heterokaryon incompatibility domain-containing protein n=1 Tax=Xylaria hypoxylon TaxID=37992 RepID=A0A4Z0Z1B7_9PEZI|nr:hypothetical protein E0Z10_g2760 [Xylaria hypoxylon]